MTVKTTNFRLGIQVGGFDLIFRGFLLEKGKGSFGLGDEAKFLQSSSWGKEGNGFDVLV